MTSRTALGQTRQDFLERDPRGLAADDLVDARGDLICPRLFDRVAIDDLGQLYEAERQVLSHRRRQVQARLVEPRCAQRHAGNVRRDADVAPALGGQVRRALGGLLHDPRDQVKQAVIESA